MKLCSKCQNEIHPKRLQILPKTTTCVNCSTTGPKIGVTIQVGEGDHTFNDLVILDEEDYNNLELLSSNRNISMDDELDIPGENLETTSITQFIEKESNITPSEDDVDDDEEEIEIEE